MKIIIKENMNKIIKDKDNDITTNKRKRIYYLILI